MARRRFIPGSNTDRKKLIALVVRITIAFEKQVSLMQEKSKREKQILSESMKLLKLFGKKIYKP